MVVKEISEGPKGKTVNQKRCFLTGAFLNWGCHQIKFLQFEEITNRYHIRGA